MLRRGKRQPNVARRYDTMPTYQALDAKLVISNKKGSGLFQMLLIGIHDRVLLAARLSAEPAFESVLIYNSELQTYEKKQQASGLIERVDRRSVSKDATFFPLLSAPHAVITPLLPADAFVSLLLLLLKFTSLAASWQRAFRVVHDPQARNCFTSGVPCRNVHVKE